MSKQPTLQALVLLAALLCLTGCGDTDVGGGGLIVPDSPLPFPDTPDKLMANFRAVYERMDFAEYRKMIHPDFIMILQESTRAEYPDVGATLTVDEELRMHDRMFSKQDVTDPEGMLVPGVQMIEFPTFARVDSWNPSLVNDVILNADYAMYDVVFLLDRGGAYSLLKGQGYIKFYVTHRDSTVNGVVKPYYQMCGQVDLTRDKAAGGKASESLSWGSVKALFR